MISGPSGVGKSSIVEAVLTATNAEFSVSATTRASRPGETDGVDYFFVSEEEFEAMILHDELLEWARYGASCYGTPRRPIEKSLVAGHEVILDIENEGARQIKNAVPAAVAIFILPPSLEELEHRLRSRGDTPPHDVARRLSVAEAQIGEAPDVYDHLVVNDDLETAIRDVLSIITYGT